MVCNRLIHSMPYEEVIHHLCHLLLFYSMASPLWYSIHRKPPKCELLYIIFMKSHLVVYNMIIIYIFLICT